MSIIEQFPHRRMEAWKWTDMRGSASESLPGLSAMAKPQFEIPDGVIVSEGDTPDGHGPMAALAKRFADKGWNIYAPENTTPEKPLVLSEMTRGHARLGMMVDKGAKLTLIEHLSGDKGALSNSDIQIHLAEGAELTRIILQDDPDDHMRHSGAHIAMGQGAKFNQFTLSYGGAMTRLETRMHMEGHGGAVYMGGAYLLDGKRHSDQTSHITLIGEGCEVEQTVRGAVTDKSRGVFQGKFHVERSGQHTDAAMRHDALMLSDRAQVRAKPELEIYADDVACEHGNTVGQLDEQALFYMRQRGIPLAQARAMITQAFLAEVFDDMEDETMRDMIVGKIGDWLEARA